MSEWITWEECPSCGDTAAVGWLRGEPVEFDCVRHCELTQEQQALLGRGRSRTSDPSERLQSRSRARRRRMTCTDSSTPHEGEPEACD